MTASYTLDREVAGEFEDVVDATVEALEDEGFGVLSDIDVRATLAEKLGASVGPYRILGACNPELARQGLEEEPELGALLPCNVVVYERDDGGVVVSAVLPEALLSIVDNEALDPIATEVETRFGRVLDAVEATTAA